MDQTENNFRKTSISYQDYYEEQYLNNEWGWFVDIEIETPHLYITKI